MNKKFQNLTLEQISKCRSEILFTRFTFTIVNCFSLLFLGFIFQKLQLGLNNKDEDFIKLMQAAAAILAPYLTIVAQGYYYPRQRKINTLKFLLFKRSLTEDEKKIIYDK